MKNKETTVVESNTLLEARHSFNLVELKMLLMVLARIKKDDKDFIPYRIYTSEFRDLAVAKGNHAYYKYLLKTSRTLRRKEIAIETEKGHLVTGYFSDIELYKNDGYMDFYISPKMKPYLLDLVSKGNFTIYDIRNVINCKSTHSIRIYQLLKQYEKIGTRIITVKDLKFILGLDPDQYPRWNNFRARILEISRKELKKHSDIYFEYETKRQGRIIDKITFTIRKQKQRRLNFDGKPEPSLEDAIPAASYHKSADETIRKIQEASVDAGPMPDNLKARLS
jgi:plasmid replication initiation protein